MLRVKLFNGVLEDFTHFNKQQEQRLQKLKYKYLTRIEIYKYIH